LNKPNYENNQRDNQKNVNEPVKGIGRHHAEQPEDEQNYEDRPKHADSPACSEIPLHYLCQCEFLYGFRAFPGISLASHFSAD
jgi:hypothetical protein